jgi:hypothetical protein
MKDHKHNFWCMHYPVVILLVIAAWLVLGAAAEKSIPATQPQGPPDKREGARGALLEARLKLLEEMKQVDPDNYRLKVPIEFFGKVLDQNDNPAIGAKIEIRLNSINGLTDHDIYTGGDGTFTLEGAIGRYITVNVYGLEGYTGVQSTGSGYYNYAEPGEFKFHVPDRDKPVVFRLWKYEKAEPLNRWLIDAMITNDGSIAWFDLNAGGVGGADVGVSFIGSSFIGKGAKMPEIRVVAGTGCGIWETRDDPMFIPPSSRGQAELKHEFVSMNKEYKDSAGNIVQGDPFRFRFYFRTANGCYSAVDADLSCGAGGVNPEMKLYVLQNPSGARNLEYDPRLEIKQ